MKRETHNKASWAASKLNPSLVWVNDVTQTLDKQR